MIDIPIGETGTIDGKLYRAKSPEYFGAKGCLVCDLHKKVDCSTVRCYEPLRAFEEVGRKDCYYGDYDECNPYDDMKWHEALVLLIILVPLIPILKIQDKIQIIKSKLKTKKWKVKT